MRTFVASLLLFAFSAVSAQVVTLPPGDYTVHSTGTTTITPVVVPPNCGNNPPATTQHNGCVAPLIGSGWDQSRTVTCTGSPPAWQVSPWVPATMPAGACNPPTTFNWQAPVAPTQIAAATKPAKGASFVNMYGIKVNRFTDHANDPVSPLHPAWLRNQYSRLQPWNADGSLQLIYQPDGGYNVFNAALPYAFAKKLNGIGGDPEFQFSPTDPNSGLYLGNYGSTILRKLNISANTSTVWYDFTNDVRTLAPDANRWSTKSEGSPSADGKIWALMGRHEQSGTWPTRAYVALDVVAKRVVWSKAASGEFDSISASPSGRYAVGNGTGSTPTIAFALDGSGLSKTLYDHGEHSDICARTDGHDALVMCNTKSGDDDGKCFAVDIDNGVRKDLFSLYNTPWIGTDYGMHISCKGYRKPGWAVFGFYGSSDNKSNLVLVNIETGAVFAISPLYAKVSSYWYEPHCSASVDLAKITCNMNFNGDDTDAYVLDMPALPLPGAVGWMQPAAAKMATKTAHPIFIRNTKPTLVN